MANDIIKEETEFQFHTGSIKGWVDKMNKERPEKFQFHTGSIRGRIETMFIEKPKGFQFHSGSIKGFPDA